MAFNVIGASTMLVVFYLHYLDAMQVYRYFWLGARPIVWLCYFAIVLELYSKMVADYPGIERLGRIVAYWALGILGGLAVLLALLDPISAQTSAAR